MTTSTLALAYSMIDGIETVALQRQLAMGLQT